jgi:hypothetical protein
MRLLGRFQARIGAVPDDPPQTVNEAMMPRTTSDRFIA